jgi:hypothetical protein
MLMVQLDRLGERQVAEEHSNDEVLLHYYYKLNL